MRGSTAEGTWASETFRGTQLGDERRSKRLVKLAEAAARHPAGTVTKVIRTPAEREGAYRLLENQAVKPVRLVESLGSGTAKKCRGENLIHVAVDQTTLSFIDRKQVRGLGRVADGAHKKRRGLEVICGLAVDEHGRTKGVSAMRWSVRPDERTTKLEPHERESMMWGDVMSDTAAHFDEHSPKTSLWFQLDAGADHSRNFFKASELGHHLTVRCAHNRRIRTDSGTKKLFEHVRSQALLGRKTIVRRLSDGRRRQVHLSIRACKVEVLLRRTPTNNSSHKAVTLWVVHVRQVGRLVKNESRIEWKLLTTYPVDNLRDALEVVDGYSLRWRVEDFFRTWKGGHCRVEDSQLRSPGAILRWAIILAAVAARIERIKHRSRAEPQAPASSEFSRDEIDTAIILSDTKTWTQGDDPPLGGFVDLVAKLGGYTGKSSGGPPGAVTISRGVDFITPAALLLSRTRERSD